MLDHPNSIDGNGVAQWGRDDQSIVVFYRGERHNAVRSQAAGMPMFDDIDMVKVIHPGENDGNGVEVEAQQWHKDRWPAQWQAYKNNIEHRVAGTPLEMLFPTSPGTVKMMNAKNIFTIQQLAGLNDEVVTRNPMFRPMKTQAEQYLHAAKKGSDHHELVAKNEALSADLANAQQDIAAMKAMISEMRDAQSATSKPRGKPGPKPKNTPVAEPEVGNGKNPFDPDTYSEGE